MALPPKRSRRTPPQSPGRALRRLLAVLLGCALAVLAAEAAYRLFRGGELGPTTNPRYVVHDPVLGWRYRPGTLARHATDEFDVEVEIGPRGFRGEWPTPLPDRRRVLVLGDSFAFGWGVEARESLSGVLAELEPTWQVWNAAVSGYGTDQQLLLLDELLPELEPDVVVSVFCWNDLGENVSSRAHGHGKPWFEHRGGRLELRGVPVPRERLGRSHLYRALRKLVRPFEGTGGGPDEPWRRTLAIYERMAARTPGTLVIVSEEERLAALAREHGGVEHVDTRAVLGGLGPAASFPRDGHWTPAAHGRIAEALAERLRALWP